MRPPARLDHYLYHKQLRYLGQVPTRIILFLEYLFSWLLKFIKVIYRVIQFKVGTTARFDNAEIIINLCVKYIFQIHTHHHFPTWETITRTQIVMKLCRCSKPFRFWPYRSNRRHKTHTQSYVNGTMLLYDRIFS